MLCPYILTRDVQANLGTTRQIQFLWTVFLLPHMTMPWYCTACTPHGYVHTSHAWPSTPSSPITSNITPNPYVQPCQPKQDQSLFYIIQFLYFFHFFLQRWSKVMQNKARDCQSPISSKVKDVETSRHRHDSPLRLSFAARSGKTERVIPSRGKQ